MRVCLDCGVSSYLLVDGRRMSEYEFVNLPSRPKNVEQRLPHTVWCPSDENRMEFAANLADRMSDALVRKHGIEPNDALVYAWTCLDALGEDRER